MPKGKVKFYNTTKGFGFIVDETSGKDVFVHATGLVDQIDSDDIVTYDEQDGKKGVNAVNVQVVR